MERILASPLAKKIASDKGIQLNQGSGENGRIIKVISKTLPLTTAPQQAAAPVAKRKLLLPCCT
jgi:pyruvate dehydrogenase E2 component (dihydrolipoamide acetyltransferase)